MHWQSSGLILLWLASSLLGITTPSAGAVLRGSVNITGSNQVDGQALLYSEIAFAYANDPTGTWFLIATNNQPVQDGVLATWDTSSITDGDYSLRLRVYLQDGTTQDVTIADLHVRNDLAASTATPPIAAEDLPTLSPAFPTPTSAAATLTPASSAPMLSPGNPASLTDASVLATFRRGALFALIAFALIGILIQFRSSR